MDELYALFKDKLYYSGFLQRRLYLKSDGKKCNREEREWIRCYAELRGPLLKCWKAGACDTDPQSIDRLKREADGNEAMEFPSLDIRLVSFEEMEDYKLETTVYNAFSFRHSNGMNEIQLMAPNSTLAKDWISTILRSSKEISVLDQRFTVKLLTSPGAPTFSDNILPEPQQILMHWLGSNKWISVIVSVEAKKGYTNRATRGSTKSKCLYLYEDKRRKKCIARLGPVKAIYALYQTSKELGIFDFVVEGEGKRKSKQKDETKGGLEITDKAWFRTSKHELWIRWISVLRNAFEISTPSAILATTGNNQHQDSTFSSTSDCSLGSNQYLTSRLPDSLIGTGRIMAGPSRKPWENKLQQQTSPPPPPPPPLLQQQLPSPPLLPQSNLNNDYALSIAPSRTRHHTYHEASVKNDDVRQNRLDWGEWPRPVDFTPNMTRRLSSQRTPIQYFQHPLYSAVPSMSPQTMVPIMYPPMGMMPATTMMYPPPPSSNPYASYNTTHSVYSADLPSRASAPLSIQPLRNSKSQPLFKSSVNDMRRFQNTTATRSILSEPPFSAITGSTKLKGTIGVSSLEMDSCPSSAIAGSKSHFISQLYKIITTKPYSKVPCSVFYHVYISTCDRVNLPSPKNVAEWMQQMGFNLKPRKLENEEPAWYHVELKRRI